MCLTVQVHRNRMLHRVQHSISLACQPPGMEDSHLVDKVQHAEHASKHCGAGCEPCLGGLTLGKACNRPGC